MHREKYVGKNVYIQIEENFQINNLTDGLRKMEKRQNEKQAYWKKNKVYTGN